MTLPTVIFVHGAWHFGGYFDKVKAILNSHGYRSVILEMPGVGRSAPVKTLDEDIDTVRSAVLKELEAGHDVVLNAHSWGGIPTNCALDGLSKSERKEQGHENGVIKLTFVACFVLPEGVSLLDATGGALPPWVEAREDGNTWLKDAVDHMYHDCDPQEAAEAASKLRGHSLATFEAKTTSAAWKKIPSAYLICEDDRAVPVEVQDSFTEGVRQQGGEIEVERLFSSHSPYVGKPDAVASFIIRAAGGNVAKA